MPVSANSILIKRAAMASIAVAVTLLLAKLAAWTVSDSTSVLSSLLDSLMDIAASVVNFFAIRYALMPADDDHPFGHTKAEGLAALIQSAFILGSAFALLLHVTDRLLNPEPLHALGESVAVMIFSAVSTTALVMYQRFVYRKTGSLAIKADSAHYYGDILTSIAVVVALLAAWAGFYWMDPLVALLIALVLIYSVYEIVTEALKVLMDQSMSDDDEAELKALIRAVEGVEGFHGLKTREAGAVQFIQLDLEMDGDQPLRDAHGIGDRVERAILARFPRAEVLIHHDPV
jgi:ferrous-iron efflux pump FieF